MQPAVASVIFYAVIIVFCELCRRSLDLIYGPHARPPRSVKTFLMESIGTLQAISCIFENQLIARYYGLLGFAVAVFILLNLHRLTNRGSICSPPAILERTFLGHLRPIDAIVVFIAELVGAAIAFRLSQLVWRLGITPDHTQLADTFNCVIAHKVPLIFVAAYEFIAVLIIRTVAGMTARRRPGWTPYAAAAAISIGQASGLALVGPVALNPIIAFGRLSGCQGLDWSQHLVTYWLAPTAGWVTALLVEASMARRSKKIR